MHGTVIAALEQIRGDVGEEPFDLVDPTRVRRGVVHVEPGVLFEPGLHCRGLMRAVVVTDEVDIEAVGDNGVDLCEELLELDAAVSAVPARDDRPIGGVERHEQARRAVAEVVVRALLGHARHHGKHGLGAGERLDLALFVDAVDDGTVGG